MFFGWCSGLFQVACISASSEILILYAAIKTLLQIISGSSFQGDMILPILIDSWVVLSVKVHTIFVLNGELILITLNKQTN